MATANRKKAIAIGVLFLVATAAYLVGSALIASATTAPDHLTNLNSDQLRLGVLLECVDAAAVVAIGVLLLPIIRGYSEGMAIGYAGTRIVECLLLLVSAVGALLLVPLGNEYAQASGTEAAHLQTLGRLLFAWHDQAFQMAMATLGVGSLTLCYALYRFKLVPRALSILGFAGYLALFASGWLGLFGRDAGSFLFIPGALFEIAFPIWLIVKGLGEPRIAAKPAPA